MDRSRVEIIGGPYAGMSGDVRREMGTQCQVAVTKGGRHTLTWIYAKNLKFDTDCTMDRSSEQSSSSPRRSDADEQEMRAQALRGNCEDAKNAGTIQPMKPCWRRKKEDIIAENVDEQSEAEKKNRHGGVFAELKTKVKKDIIVAEPGEKKKQEKPVNVFAELKRNLRTTGRKELLLAPVDKEPSAAKPAVAAEEARTHRIPKKSEPSTVEPSVVAQEPPTRVTPEENDASTGEPSVMAQEAQTRVTLEENDASTGELSVVAQEAQTRVTPEANDASTGEPSVVAQEAQTRVTPEENDASTGEPSVVAQEAQTPVTPEENDASTGELSMMAQEAQTRVTLEENDASTGELSMMAQEAQTRVTPEENALSTAEPFVVTEELTQEGEEACAAEQAIVAESISKLLTPGGEEASTAEPAVAQEKVPKLLTPEGEIASAADPSIVEGEAPTLTPQEKETSAGLAAAAGEASTPLTTEENELLLAESTVVAEEAPTPVTQEEKESSTAEPNMVGFEARLLTREESEPSTAEPSIVAEEAPTLAPEGEAVFAAQAVIVAEEVSTSLTPEENGPSCVEPLIASQEAAPLLTPVGEELCTAEPVLVAGDAQTLSTPKENELSTENTATEAGEAPALLTPEENEVSVVKPSIVVEEAPASVTPENKDVSVLEQPIVARKAPTQRTPEGEDASATEPLIVAEEAPTQLIAEENQLATAEPPTIAKDDPASLRPEENEPFTEQAVATEKTQSLAPIGEAGETASVTQDEVPPQALKEHEAPLVMCSDAPGATELSRSGNMDASPAVVPKPGRRVRRVMNGRARSPRSPRAAHESEELEKNDGSIDAETIPSCPPQGRKIPNRLKICFKELADQSDDEPVRSPVARPERLTGWAARQKRIERRQQRAKKLDVEEDAGAACASEDEHSHMTAADVTDRQHEGHDVDQERPASVRLASCAADNSPNALPRDPPSPPAPVQHVPAASVADAQVTTNTHGGSAALEGSYDDIVTPETTARRASEEHVDACCNVTPPSPAPPAPVQNVPSASVVDVPVGKSHHGSITALECSREDIVRSQNTATDQNAENVDAPGTVPPPPPPARSQNVPRLSVDAVVRNSGYSGISTRACVRESIVNRDTTVSCVSDENGDTCRKVPPPPPAPPAPPAPVQNIPRASVDDALVENSVRSDIATVDPIPREYLGGDVANSHGSAPSARDEIAQAPGTRTREKRAASRDDELAAGETRVGLQGCKDGEPNGDVLTNVAEGTDIIVSPMAAANALDLCVRDARMNADVASKTQSETVFPAQTSAGDEEWLEEDARRSRVQSRQTVVENQMENLASELGRLRRQLAAMDCVKNGQPISGETTMVDVACQTDLFLLEAYLTKRFANTTKVEHKEAGKEISTQTDVRRESRKSTGRSVGLSLSGDINDLAELDSMAYRADMKRRTTHDESNVGRSAAQLSQCQENAADGGEAREVLSMISKELENNVEDEAEVLVYQNCIVECVEWSQATELFTTPVRHLGPEGGADQANFFGARARRNTLLRSSSTMDEWKCWAASYLSTFSPEKDGNGSDAEDIASMGRVTFAQGDDAKSNDGEQMPNNIDLKSLAVNRDVDEDSEWMTVWSSEYQRCYYWNPSTDEVSWIQPVCEE